MIKSNKKIKTAVMITAAVLLAVLIVFAVHRVMYVSCVVEPLERAAQAEGFNDVIFSDPANGQALLYNGNVYEKQTELCGKKGTLRLRLATKDHSKVSKIEFICDEPITKNGKELIISASIYPYDRLWWDSYHVGIYFYEEVSSSEVVGGASSSVSMGLITDRDGDLKSDTETSDKQLYESVKDDYLEILDALEDEYKRMCKEY